MYLSMYLYVCMYVGFVVVPCFFFGGGGFVCACVPNLINDGEGETKTENTRGVK